VTLPDHPAAGAGHGHALVRNMGPVSGITSLDHREGGMGTRVVAA
jgi:hypothetical protein